MFNLIMGRRSLGRRAATKAYWETETHIRCRHKGDGRPQDGRSHKGDGRPQDGRSHKGNGRPQGDYPTILRSTSNRLLLHLLLLALFASTNAACEQVEQAGDKQVYKGKASKVAL